MTEERKQELIQLLNQAMGSLVIRNEYGSPVSIPVDVYRRYLRERWRYFGIKFLPFAFSIYFTPDIADGVTKSKLLHCIREELAPFIEKGTTPAQDFIQTASYIVRNDSTHGDCLYKEGPESPIYFFMVLERLLKITLVRGVEKAVSFFERCSRPEGTCVFIRDIGLLEGLKLDTEVEVFEGVRLIPLPSSEISREVERHLLRLFRLPFLSITDRNDSIFGKTLLVIDQPGFSMLSKPTEKAIPSGTRIADLPFQVEPHKVTYPDEIAVDSFQTLFCHALSLACDSPAGIFVGFYALEEDKSLHRPHASAALRLQGNPLGTSVEVKEADIEKAKNLYKRLVDLDLNDREKLRIPIDRWVKSKTSASFVDKMIDLGIAFETLYLSGIGETTELSFRFRLHASWHLGKDKEHRNKLLTKFGQIYGCRSRAVHNGKLDEQVRFGEERIPISEFIERSQDLCRKSIVKILEDGQFPDWNKLILGDGIERSTD